MAPRSDLPRPLRRVAARRAGPRSSPPDPRLLDAVRSGALPESWAKHHPGTAGAKAIRSVQYARRTANRPPGVTARERAGHETAVVRNRREISILVDRPPRWAVVVGPTRSELRRAQRYNALTSNLSQGKITPRAFERRVSSWASIAGERFLADAAAVLAILDERRAGEEELYRYRAGRAA